ncbi:MAG: ABC transporter permease [Candidatus Diapherotrites archaeon]|nr:ABC transporter permease [Candidatus Diapherotrites archaeon]
MVEINYIGGGLWKRTAAFIADSLVALAIILVFWQLNLSIYSINLGGLIAVVYMLCKDGLLSGQSIGKKLLNLKTIKISNSQPARIWDSILRNCIFLIPGTELIAFFQIALAKGKNPDTRRVGDGLAKTMVVDLNEQIIAEGPKELSKKALEKTKKESRGNPLFEKIDELPGLTVFKIALKELNLIKSQKAGLLTALTLAVVVMATLALSFGGNNAITQVDVAIYAPKSVKDFNIDYFKQSLSKSGLVKMHNFNSKEKVLESIKKRESKVGIVVNNPESKFGKYVIDLYYDNSSISSSAIFFEVAKSQVQNIGYSMSQSLLKEIWGELGQINKDLGNEVSRIDDFILKLDESDRKLNQLEADLNELNIADAKGALSRQSEKISQFNEKIDEFDSELDGFLATIEDMNSKINATRTKVAAYKVKIAKSQGDIGYLSARLSSTRQTIEQSPEPARTELLGVVDDINAQINEVQTELSGVYTDLSGIEVDLAEFSAKINQPETGIRAKLQKNKQDIQALKTDISETQNDLNKMEVFVNKLDQTLSEVKTLIANSKEQKKEVGAKLKESKRMIGSFMDSLKELGRISPEFLADPLILNKIQVFKVERLGIAVPIALVLLLLLTTILLTGVSFVDERNQGAYSRMVLSTTPKSILFAGKILGQLIFALIQAAIIIALLLLLDNFTNYKITIAGSLIEVFLAIVLVSFAFINWGLLISNFTKNQGTTILMSLLFIIPMLFLSGVIMPLELMNPIIQGFAQVLPLTVSITMLSEVMVKGNTIGNLGFEAIVLLIPAFAILALTLLNKNLR